MTKHELMLALRESANKEFAQALENVESNPHTFSEKFSSDMENVIRFQRNLNRRLFSSIVRRGVVAALILSMLFAGFHAFPLSHASSTEFILTHHEVSVNIRIKNPSHRDHISTKYDFAEVPNGVWFYKERGDSSSNRIYYKDNKFNMALQLSQSLQYNYNRDPDNEHGEWRKVSFDGNPALVYINYAWDRSTLIWLYDGYVFTLYCDLGAIDDEELFNLARMVQPVE